MKKIFLLIILLFSFNVVNALSIDMVCPSEISYDEELNISVYLNRNNNEDSISAIEGILSYNDVELMLAGYSNLLLDWTTFSNDNKFAFGNLRFNNLITDSREKVFDIKFIVLKEIDNVNLSIDNIVVIDSNGDEIKINNPTKCSTKVLSNTNTLDNISVSKGNLSPTFAPNTNIYSVSVDTDIINIDYTKSNDKEEVICDCNDVKLNYGNNIIKIFVTSESGLLNTYIINVNRIDNRKSIPNNDNSLSSLAISNGTIDFSKDNTLYNATVSGDIDKVTITSKLSSKTSSYLEWESQKTVSLSYGMNEFNIKVMAENGDIKIYTLNITRLDNRDDNNYLSNLVISSGSIEFDTNILEYVINVDSDVDKVNITPTVSSKKATVEISGPDKLEFGDNNYQISVKAENGKVRVYKLKIIRNLEEKILSNVALLESLTIYGYDIEFNSNVFEYSIVSGEKRFKISAIPMENGSYYVLNDGNVDSNNKLVIRVTAEDGTINNYVIRVKNIASGGEKSFVKAIPVVIICVLFTVCLICYIYVGKKELLKK